MNHGDIQQQLGAYLDGELTPEQNAAVEQALVESAELREQLERWRSVHASAGRLVTEGRVAPQLKESLRRRLAAAHQGRRRRTLALVLTVTGIAAAAILTIQFRESTVVRNWLGNSTPIARAVLAPSTFAGVFHACGEKSIDGAEYANQSPAAVHKALSAKEPFKVWVPALNGYQIAGACRCFRDSAINVVAVHYYGANVQPSHVTVFSVDRGFSLSGPTKVEPYAHGQERPYVSASADTVSILTWDERGGHFALCGEADSQALKRLADSVAVTEMRVDLSSLALADLIGSPVVRP